MEEPKGKRAKRRAARGKEREKKKGGGSQLTRNESW
jgi:hypothetical protein